MMRMVSTVIETHSDDQRGGIFSESSSHTDEDEPPIQQQQPRKKRKQTQSKFPSMFNQDNWEYWDKENIEPLDEFPPFGKNWFHVRYSR